MWPAALKWVVGFFMCRVVAHCCTLCNNADVFCCTLEGWNDLLKNVESTPIVLGNGVKATMLINPDGSENYGYSMFRDHLLKKKKEFSQNTVTAYTRAIAYFFDYLYEAAEIHANGQLTR